MFGGGQGRLNRNEHRCAGIGSGHLLRLTEGTGVERSDFVDIALQRRRACAGQQQDHSEHTCRIDRLRVAIGRHLTSMANRLATMPLDWEQVIVPAIDPDALGRWWLEALGWELVDDEPPVFEIRPRIDQTPGLLFVPAADTKSGKNRLHLDFRPDDQDREVERLVSLGAQLVDVGQGDVSWRVLADPEGNEFCILSSAVQ